ncbi:hypothetical protein GCM10020295_24780 [Streptomyces cinereospinus]
MTSCSGTASSPLVGANTARARTTWKYLKGVPETSSTAVVLTALPEEYDAVRAHLGDTEELVHEDGTRVERGRLAGTAWTVAVAELGEGAVNAAALTMQIVSWLRPEALLFVGVAGGLKDDVEIGDVVVGTKVYAVQGGKQTPSGFLARPEVWHGSHRLLQAARSALRDLEGCGGTASPSPAGTWSWRTTGPPSPSTSGGPTTTPTRSRWRDPGRRTRRISAAGWTPS